MTDLATFPFRPEPLAEVETFSKPGTADVTASDLKKISPIVRHYAKEAHPFTACKRDQIKHGLSEDHANRRCSVVKSLGKAMEDASTVDEVAESIGWTVEQLAGFVAEQRAHLKILTTALGPAAIAEVIAGTARPDNLTEADAELTTLAEEAVAVVQLFGNQPLKVGEAYNPPSWTLPPAAKTPGFKPLKPPSTKTSSTSSSSNSSTNNLHPHDPHSGEFLQKGGSGEAIKGVQSKLGVKTTGTFESQTRKAVMSYQRKNGLQVDGVVGDQTAASLLGKSSRAPGSLSKGLRSQLKGLVGKLKAERVEEEEAEAQALEEGVIHVQHTQREDSTKAAATSSIRSALFNLSDPDTDTHMVKLPNGTTVMTPPRSGRPNYGSYRRHFEVSNGKETRTAMGTDEAADVAKELDSRSTPPAKSAGATGLK